MALDATVVRAPLSSPRFREAAPSPDGVTFQAAIAVVGRPLFGRRQPMWVVARGASELARATSITSAGMHLLDVSNRFGRTGVLLAGDEHHEEFMQRQARTELECRATEPLDARSAPQMALLADRLAQRRIEVGGIHDREIATVRKHSRIPDVQRSGTVASFAPNRQSPEGRRLVAVNRPHRRIESVGVAEDATGVYGSLEMVVLGQTIRREVPSSLLRVPTDRRLKEAAIALDQVRPAAMSRAYLVGHLGLDPCDLALRVLTRLGMNNVPIPTLNRIFQAAGSKAHLARVTVQTRCHDLVRERHGAAHRMLMIRRGDLRMATRTGGVADKFDSRLRILVGSRTGSRRSSEVFRHAAESHRAPATLPPAGQPRAAPLPASISDPLEPLVPFRCLNEGLPAAISKRPSATRSVSLAFHLARSSATFASRAPPL